MAEAIVSDWLADYAALEPAELRSFAADHEHNHEISHALFTVINERTKYPELMHTVCQQLCSFYRSGDASLRKFTLQFLPSLIYVYLNCVAQGDKKSCRSVETLLIYMYNVEVSTDDGHERRVAFRMPVLAQASVYHEAKSLNASDLRRWEENSNKDVQWGPLPPVETINAQNRLKVMTALMFMYNQQLALIQKAALAHLCRVASLLATQGFSRPGHAHRASYGTDPSQAIVPKPLPRIPVSGAFLVELLHSVYFAMFNDFGSIAIQSVEDIHQRGGYELLPEVILVSHAVRNSLHANPSGQPSDGPMGISVALTPATTTVTVSKSMITNASFRTKKLPDDIPIQALNADGSGPGSAGSGSSTPLTGGSVGIGGGVGGGGGGSASIALLLSISEEASEAAGNSGGGVGDNLGHRNATGRGSGGSKSSDTPRVHKAPFSAFMSSKSKDKEASKQRDREAAAAAAAASGRSNGTGSAAAAKASSAAASGPSVVPGTAHRKEKFVNRNSIGAQLQISGDSADSGGAGDKTSPCSVVKRHIDFGMGAGTATSPTASAVALPSSAMSNGDATAPPPPVPERSMRSVSQDFHGVHLADLQLVDGSSNGSAADAFGESKRISVVEAKVHGMSAATVQVSQL